MLNKIWFALLAIGLVYGIAKGAWLSFHPPERPPAAAPAADANAVPESEMVAMGRRLSQAPLDAAKSAVELCITLIGVMAVWLGLLNVAKDAGLVDAFARLVKPLMHWLFPEVPDGHPAQGAMLMNFAANILGLNNAATPMGLKAMRELQELNLVKDTATNSMAQFLAINCSSITIVPFTIMGYRIAKGSHNPAEPLAGTLLATSAGVIVAVIAARWLSHLPRFQITPEEFAAAAGEPSAMETGGNP